MMFKIRPAQLSNIGAEELSSQLQATREPPSRLRRSLRQGMLFALALFIVPLQRTPVQAGSVPDNDAISAWLKLDNMIALRTFPTEKLVSGQSVSVLGYYAGGDGGGGFFQWDPSNETEDNGGTIIAPIRGAGRWIRYHTSEVDAKWFGAKPSNDTADAATNLAAFKASLSYAQSVNATKLTVSGNEGGSVFYVKADDVANDSCAFLVKGAGLTLEIRATIKTAATTLPLHRIVEVTSTARNVRITGGGKLYGVRSGPIGRAENGMIVALYGGDNVQVDSLVFQDAWSDCIYVGSAASNIRIFNNRLDGARRNGISVVYASNVEISHNVISGTQGGSVEAAVDIEPDAGQTVSHVEIHHNTIIGSNMATHFGGLYVHSAAGGLYAVSDVELHHNQILNCSLTATALLRVNIDKNTVILDGGVSAAIGIYAEQNAQVNVTDNHVTGASDGIWFVGNTCGTISRNIITTGTGHGITVRGQLTHGSHRSATFVCENHIDSVSLDGIRVSGGIDVRVAGNYVANAGNSGIYVRDSSENCVVENNTVVGSSRLKSVSFANINLAGTKNVIISDNVLRVSDKYHTGTAQAGGAASITLDSAADIVDGFYVGKTIFITAGTGSGQSKVITAYNGTTLVAAVGSNWVPPPDSTSVFNIRETWSVDRHISLFNTDVVGTIIRGNSVDSVVTAVRDNGARTTQTEGRQLRGL